jgi:hypothetical protein
MPNDMLRYNRGRQAVGIMDALPASDLQFGPLSADDRPVFRPSRQALLTAAPSFSAPVRRCCRIIAQRIAHQTLRLALAGPVEEPEQIVNDGVGMHALGFHVRL